MTGEEATIVFAICQVVSVVLMFFFIKDED